MTMTQQARVILLKHIHPFQLCHLLSLYPPVALPFLIPVWTSGSSRFTYYWSLAWRILSITLLVCEMRAIVQQFEHSLALPFFEIGMKTYLFLSCGHCRVFQICWHIEYSILTASSFRIWNSSAGILSPPLALFSVMLPKVQLTLHSRISALGEWSHHHGYLGHEGLFCTVLLCILVTYLLLLLGPYHFCPLLCPSLYDMCPWYL